MPPRGVRRGATVIGSATPSHAPIYVDSDDNLLKYIPAGSGTTEVAIADASTAQTLTNKTLTSPIINSPTGLIKLTSITASTYAPSVAESGTTFIFNRAAGIAVTLPTEAGAAGVWYRFVVGTNFTTNGTMVPAGTNTMRGTIVSADGAAGESSAAADTVTFVAATDVVGDSFEVYCDGTNWYLTGVVAADGGATFA